MTKRKLGCTRITLEGEHPKNCKCETAFEQLDNVELINPYEKDSEAYANWDFGNSIKGLKQAVKELEEEYEEYDKIYHNPKLIKYGSEEERELHDKLWALNCNLCVLKARIKEKEQNSK